jgi:hypothetical protein
MLSSVLLELRFDNHRLHFHFHAAGSVVTQSMASTKCGRVLDFWGVLLAAKWWSTSAFQGYSNHQV